MECENGVCKLPTATATPKTTGAAATTSVTIPEQFKAFPWSHFVNAAGKHVPTSALQRPLTLYFFSAAWCPPCRKVSPTVEALHQQHNETDLDIVYVGLDKTHEEHRAKAKLPYFKFTWFQDEDLQLPIPIAEDAEQPAGNDNPFRLTFRDALLSTGRMGIPTIVVVDAATGKVIDTDATLPLMHATGSKTLDADLKTIVARWRAGQQGSTRWMRIKSTVVDGVMMFVYFYIVFPALDAMDWIKAKFAKTIEAAPAAPAAESQEEAKREIVEQVNEAAEVAEEAKAETVATEQVKEEVQEPAMECEGGVCLLPAVKKECESAQAA